jgi:iron complex outermembrane recepter protein
MALVALFAGAPGAIAQTAPGSPAASAASSAPASSAPAATASDDTVHLPQVEVVATTPLQGTGLDVNSVPTQANVLRPEDIARGGMPNATRALEEQVGGVALSSASGNPFQPTLFYHGFAASPLQGTAQGLAVYVNGVRFNQPFGDTMNWDLIPDNAIQEMQLVGSNPVFGLNALGGALSMQLKNGFTYHGAEGSIYGGSFGTVDGDLEYGKQVGNAAAYVAFGERHQNGWRDLQSSNIQSLYGDAGWRGDKAEVHLSVLAANSDLNGPGTSPVELLAVDPRAQFTAPNAIGNDFVLVTLNGTYDVSDTLSLQSLVYYQNFVQRVTNGNAPNDTPCDDGSGYLCYDGGVSTTRGGVPIPDFLNGGPYSELDNQTTNTNGYGFSLQGTETGRVFGLANQLVTGVSFDGAVSDFSATAFVGGMQGPDRVFIGPGVVIDEPGTNSPVRVQVTDSNWGIFATDTLNITDRLAATLSGRFNASSIDLNDQNGGDLSGNHPYTSFNPAAGLTYQVAPWLNVYGGYAQSTRTPTPAELSCAGPTNSCSLANFFVGDPDLKQVTAQTFEAGVRGATTFSDKSRLDYQIGLYHTDLDNDIAFVNSVTLNRAYFANIGSTQRQGVDAALHYRAERWNGFVAYSYTNATFRSGFVESAGSNPAGNADGNIVVRPGNQIPGIPPQQLKFGANYLVTPQWTVGFTAIANSSQYLVGDDSNQNKQLPGYFTVNLTTDYRIGQHIDLFGTVENITNARYYTYGTFSPTSSVYMVQAPGATNPRAYSIAAPVGGYAGLRVTF